MTAETRTADLSREEQIAPIHELIEENRQLAAEIMHLQQPPNPFQNLSRPLSRDFKTEKKKRPRSRKQGAKLGHEKQERQSVDKPNKVIEAYVDNGKKCQRNLLDQVPVQVVRRQVTEIPESKPVVIETRQSGKLPEGLETMVTSLQHDVHVGYKRLCQICDELFGLELGADGAVSIVARAGQVAAEAAEAIGEQVRWSKVIGSDETSARVHGRNYWQWVFVSGHREYHVIVPSRGYEVIENFMQESEAEVWVCDCWNAQLNAPAKLCRICLSHQTRNLQGLIDGKTPAFVVSREMQTLFRKALHLRNRRATMTARGYSRQVTIVEMQLKRLLTRTFKGLGTNLLERYRKYRHSLFIFWRRADVPAHTNACERALRLSVIHRKVRKFPFRLGRSGIRLFSDCIEYCKTKWVKRISTISPFDGHTRFAFPDTTRFGVTCYKQ